jgi:hypothetical protein
VGEENALFISATHKENFEEFRERVYEAVRQIHITRFLQQILYPITKTVEKEEKTKKKTNNVLLHIKYSIPLTFQEGFFCMSQLLLRYSCVSCSLFFV